MSIEELISEIREAEYVKEKLESEGRTNIQYYKDVSNKLIAYEQELHERQSRGRGITAQTYDIEGKLKGSGGDSKDDKWESHNKLTFQFILAKYPDIAKLVGFLQRKWIDRRRETSPEFVNATDRLKFRLNELGINWKMYAKFWEILG
jgi:hypothetical protein